MGRLDHAGIISKPQVIVRAQVENPPARRDRNVGRLRAVDDPFPLPGTGLADRFERAGEMLAIGVVHGTIGLGTTEQPEAGRGAPQISGAAGAVDGAIAEG